MPMQGSQVKVRPASAEVKVAKPSGGLLDVEGEDVTWSRYWDRILRDGDIVVVDSES